MKTNILLILAFAVASIASSTPPPLVFPRTETRDVDQSKAVAAMVAAGYTIKVATDSVVVSEPMEYASAVSTGAWLPVRESAQIAITDGVATVHMKTECDYRNQYLINPNPEYPVTWKPCGISDSFPMSEAKARFSRIVLMLGGRPPPMDPDPEPSRR